MTTRTRPRERPRSCRVDVLGVDDIGGAAGGEQPAYAYGVGSPERHDVGGHLAGEPDEGDLALRMAQYLRERRCRQGDAGPGLASTLEQDQHAPMSPLEGDEPAAVGGDPGH